MCLDDHTFHLLADLVHKEAGLSAGPQHKGKFESRLLRRVRHHALEGYERYYALLLSDPEEKQTMIDLMTVNETRFFREERHFAFLKEFLKGSDDRQKVRLWSAAASVGAEAYSMAMICDTIVPMNRWEVVGTDINRDVIRQARMGLYPLGWAESVSEEMRKHYFLKGKGKYEGSFLVDRALAKNTRFLTHNLLHENSDLGLFDIAFLRNILYYFDKETKKKVIDNVTRHIVPGGYLVVSHTESLLGLHLPQLKQKDISIHEVRP